MVWILYLSWSILAILSDADDVLRGLIWVIAGLCCYREKSREVRIIGLLLICSQVLELVRVYGK